MEFSHRGDEGRGALVEEDGSAIALRWLVRSDACTLAEVDLSASDA